MTPQEKTANLEVRKAAARFTRVKQEHDGTVKAEARYQKAKRDLDRARKAARAAARAPGNGGVAQLTTINVSKGA